MGGDVAEGRERALHACTVSPYAAADGGDGEPFGASGVGAGSTDLAELVGGAGTFCSAFVRTHT